MANTKWCHFRDYVYGLDTTEFDDDLMVILYDTKEEAEESLRDYIDGVNHAHEIGDVYEPYQDDVSVREVTLSEGEGVIVDSITQVRYSIFGN